MMGNMNMNYTYPTIIYESVFAQMFIFVVENIIYNICLNCVFHGRWPNQFLFKLTVSHKIHPV